MVSGTIDVESFSLTEIDKPKRNRSAYSIFFEKELARIYHKCAIDKKRPNFEKLTQHIAKLWKNLDPKNRQYMNNLAAKDKIRYEEEMQQYEIGCDIDSKSTNRQPNRQHVSRNQTMLSQTIDLNS